MEIGSCVSDEDLKIDAEEVVATSATRGTHGGSFQPPHYPLEMYVSAFPPAKDQRWRPHVSNEKMCG